MALFCRLPGGVTNKKGAKHLWCKFTPDGKTLIELVVDKDVNAYPDGEVKDGYFYQRIVYVVGADDTGTYLLEL